MRRKRSEILKENKMIRENIRAYLGLQFTFRGIDDSLVPFVMEISKHMSSTKRQKDDIDNKDGYENIICTSSDVRKLFAEDMKISEQDINKAIYRLIKHGVLQSVFDKKGKKIRTMYFVADWIFSVKEWPKILSIGKEGNSLNERAMKVVSPVFD